MDENLPIEIPIEVQEVAKAMADLRAVAKEVDNLDRSVRRMNKDMKKAGGFASAAFAGAGSAGSLTKSAPAVMVVQRMLVHAQQVAVIGLKQSGGSGQGGGSNGGGGFLHGPAQRLQRAYQNLQKANASGNSAQIFDARRNYAQAQAALKKAMAPPPSVGQKVWQAIASSRFSMQGGFHLLPLVGRTIAALGPMGTAISVAALAAVEAGKEIYEMAKHAAEAGAELARIGRTAGGDSGQTAQLSVMGNALGVDMGALARQFADRISSDGMAAGFAARGGIHDYGSFDTTNKAEKLLAWVDHLSKLSDTDAMRAARVTGTEALLPLRGLSDKTKQNLAGDAGIKQQIFDPQFQKDSLEFQVAMARTQDAFMNFVVVVVKPMLPMIIGFLDNVTKGFQVVSAMIDANKDKFFAFWQGVSDVIEGLVTFDFAKMRKGVQEIWDAPKAKKSEDSHTDAMNRHADALNDATYAMKNGVYGGGERARNAVPSKWMGIDTEKYVGDVARLGAFSL